MKKGIQTVYEKHHKESRGKDFSIYKKERGSFIRGNIGTGKKVLDIGCRDGVLTSEFSKGNNVLGVDIDKDALDRCKKRLGINTQHVDLNGEWDINDKFNAVVAGEVIEHLYFPEEVIKKIVKVLKADGVFIGTVPNGFSILNRLRLFFGTKIGTTLQDPTHINHFTYNELERLLRRYFKRVEILGLVDDKFKTLSKISPGLFSFIFMWKCRGVK